MLRINELTLAVGESIENLKKAAAECIGVKPSDFTSFEISKNTSQIEIVFTSKGNPPAAQTPRFTASER